MLKVVIMLSMLLSSCSMMSTHREQRREDIKDCVKEMLEYDVSVIEAYKICKDLHVRKNSNKN